MLSDAPTSALPVIPDHLGETEEDPPALLRTFPAAEMPVLGSAGENHSHRLELTAERIEDKTQRLERDGAEERLVLGLTKNHRGGCPVSVQLEHALAHLSGQRRPVSQHKIQRPHRFEAEGTPLLPLEHRVDRSRIDKEADAHITNFQIVQIRNFSATVNLDAKITGTTASPASSTT